MGVCIGMSARGSNGNDDNSEEEINVKRKRASPKRCRVEHYRLLA